MLHSGEATAEGLIVVCVGVAWGLVFMGACERAWNVCLLDLDQVGGLCLFVRACLHGGQLFLRHSEFSIPGSGYLGFLYDPSN